VSILVPRRLGVRAAVHRFRGAKFRTFILQGVDLVSRGRL
jgi:hypothetical protein